MNTLALLAPLALMQVGPNPNAANTLGVPDELANRPARPATTQALAVTDANTAWLKTCLEQVESEPARAHALAQIKRSEASGTQRVVANHCLGLAASKLGLWEDARTAFIEARSETPESEIRAKARFGAMAGNAAMPVRRVNGAYIVRSLGLSTAILTRHSMTSPQRCAATAA